SKRRRRCAVEFFAASGWLLKGTETKARWKPPTRLRLDPITMTHKVYITDRNAVSTSLALVGGKVTGTFLTGGKSFIITFTDQDANKTMDITNANYFLSVLWETVGSATWLNMEQTLYFGDRVVSVHIHPKYI
ncbi:hypothetical protein BGW39_005175, partial [Mortierella sp. 14UC]